MWPAAPRRISSSPLKNRDRNIEAEIFPSQGFFVSIFLSKAPGGRCGGSSISLPWGGTLGSPLLANAPPQVIKIGSYAAPGRTNKKAM